MNKIIITALSLCASLYAYDENIFKLDILKGKEFDIYLYSSKKTHTSYGLVQNKQKQYSFWGSARNGEYYIDIADFGTCALKNTFQNKFKALCKINEEKKELDFLSLQSKAKIYQVSVKKEKKLQNDKSIEFDFSEDILKFSSADKKLMQIIDDFNENLDQNSLKQKAKENLEKWQKEENISNEFFSQAFVFYQDAHVISLGKNIYEYKGGAHGMTHIIRKTYNIDDMKLLRLKKELKLDNEDFQEMMKQKITSLYDVKELFDLKEFKMSEIFELREDGINFIWEPYEIAPYSTGVVEVFVSFEELKPFWKSNSKLAYLSLIK